jgi:putative membrane protein insertion efficiency factor
MNVGQWIVTSGLRIYKCAASPILHTLVGPFGGCRFHPTCSVYAREAVERHGLARGCWLAAKRICKCHPFGPCGEDPVPPQLSSLRS